MPRNNKMKRTSVRKSRKGGQQQENRSAVFPRTQLASQLLAHRLLGLPQTRRLTLQWWNADSFTMTEGIYAEQAAVLNSPYDPDPTLGGESAQGFAKNMAFYSKCFVTRARWRIDWNVLLSSGLAPNTAPTFVGVTITTNTSSLSSAINAINNGLCEYRLLGQNPDTCKMEGVVDIGAFLNKPQVLDDPDLFCTSSANPNQIVALHNWALGTSGNNTVYYGVLLQFDCVFTDPIPFT
jgi:hypothetical protein